MDNGGTHGMNKYDLVPRFTATYQHVREMLYKNDPYLLKNGKHKTRVRSNNKIFTGKFVIIVGRHF